MMPGDGGSGLKFFKIILFQHGITPLAMMCLHVNRIAHLACNFNSRIESKGHRQSRIRGKSGNNSETVQHRDVVTTDH